MGITDTERTLNRPILRGWNRVRELAAEDEAATKAIVTALIDDWPGKPTAAQRVVIDEVAALSVRLRRLRSWGRHREADEVSIRLTRAVRTLGLPSPERRVFGSASPDTRRGALREYMAQRERELLEEGASDVA
jgi:hypothetical protein